MQGWVVAAIVSQGSRGFGEDSELSKTDWPVWRWMEAGRQASANPVLGSQATHLLAGLGSVPVGTYTTVTPLLASHTL